MSSYRCVLMPAVSRGKGKSAIAKAAYNARTQLRNERTGELTADYSYKGKVAWSAIFVDPKFNAPDWIQDRGKLWNAAIAAEKRNDAREGQELQLNAPCDLPFEKQLFMLKDFVRENITRGTGRIADVNMHQAPDHGDDRNTHFHVFMTTRAIGPDGFSKKKLPDFTPEQIVHLKKKWAELGEKLHRREAANEREAGNNDRAAYLEREADRWAEGWRDRDRQIQAARERGDLEHAIKLESRRDENHLGPQVAAMERNGQQTERGNIYRDTEQRNQQHQQTAAELKREFAEIQKAIEQEERVWAEQQRPEQQRAVAQPQPGTLPPPQPTPQPTPQAHPEPPAPVMARDLNGPARDIWTAFTHSDSPAAFAAALTASRLRLARVAQEDLPKAEPEQDERKEYAMLTSMKNNGVWMLAMGGVPALNEKQLESAERSYDSYQHQKNDSASLDFRAYVSHVQEKNAERLEHLTARAALLGFEKEQADKGQQHAAVRARQGTYVVITERGYLYHLNQRTTGENFHDAQEFLKTLDSQPVQSVTDARKAIEQERTGRQKGQQSELKGITARVFSEWQRNNEDMSFTAMLDKIGVRFAIATKDEAERSHKQAELARAAGNYAPSFKEGELVAVTRPSLLYWTPGGDIVALNRVHKLQEGAENFLPDIDKTKLKTIEATKADLTREAREQSEDRASIRVDRAAETGPFRAFRPLQTTRRWILAANDKAHELSTVTQKPMRVIGSVVNTAAKLFDALFSFFDPGPPKTREQIEIMKDDRDRSRFASEQIREQVQRHDTQVTVHERIAEATREIQQLAEKNARDFQRYRSDERERDRD